MTVGFWIYNIIFRNCEKRRENVFENQSRNRCALAPACFILSLFFVNAAFENVTICCFLTITPTDGLILKMLLAVQLDRQNRDLLSFGISIRRSE